MDFCNILFGLQNDLFQSLYYQTEGSNVEITPNKSQRSGGRKQYATFRNEQRFASPSFSNPKLSVFRRQTSETFQRDRGLPDWNSLESACLSVAELKPFSTAARLRPILSRRKSKSESHDEPEYFDEQSFLGDVQITSDESPTEALDTPNNKDISFDENKYRKFKTRTHGVMHRSIDDLLMNPKRSDNLNDALFERVESRDDNRILVGRGADMFHSSTQLSQKYANSTPTAKDGGKLSSPQTISDSQLPQNSSPGPSSRQQGGNSKPPKTHIRRILAGTVTTATGLPDAGKENGGVMNDVGLLIEKYNTVFSVDNHRSNLGREFEILSNLHAEATLQETKPGNLTQAAIRNAHRRRLTKSGDILDEPVNTEFDPRKIGQRLVSFSQSLTDLSQATTESPKNPTSKLNAIEKLINAMKPTPSNADDQTTNSSAADLQSGTVFKKNGGSLAGLGLVGENCAKQGTDEAAVMKQKTDGRRNLLQKQNTVDSISESVDDGDAPSTKRRNTLADLAVSKHLGSFQLQMHLFVWLLKI